MRSAGLPPLLTTVARCFAGAAALIYVYDLSRQLGAGLTDGGGRPFGDDFINYWSGAYLAWHGRVAEIYDPAAFHVFEQSVVGAPLNGYHYSYPPVLLLLTAPLALIAYVPALFAWLVASWYAFYRVLRLAIPEKGALLFALATPAVFINAIGGQNGAWTAALFGGGLGLLERRPWLAGSLLGLLVYKPQLGLLIPVALIAGRHWRAFAAAGVVAGGLVLISVLGFGVDAWTAYGRNLGVLREMILEDGSGVWHRFVSVFVAARRLGASVELAYVIQGVAGALACIAVAWTWVGRAPAGIKNAVLVLGTCLATPYLQDYDLVFTAIVVAWIWREADASLSDQALLACCGLLLMLPLLAASLAHLTGQALGPLFIAPLFVLAVSRGRATRLDREAGAAAA
jgi:arabinofuranan 3-O-arabinosyltransferase